MGSTVWKTLTHLTAEGEEWNKVSSGRCRTWWKHLTEVVAAKEANGSCEKLGCPNYSSTQKPLFCSNVLLNEQNKGSHGCIYEGTKVDLRVCEDPDI